LRTRDCPCKEENSLDLLCRKVDLAKASSGPVAVIGDENAGYAAAPTLMEEHDAATPFDEYPNRRRAAGGRSCTLQQGGRRTSTGHGSRIVVAAERQADTASHMSDWLSSPGLQSPRRRQVLSTSGPSTPP